MGTSTFHSGPIPKNGWSSKNLPVTRVPRSIFVFFFSRSLPWGLRENWLIHLIDRQKKIQTTKITTRTDQKNKNAAEIGNAAPQQQQQLHSFGKSEQNDKNDPNSRSRIDFRDSFTKRLVKENFFFFFKKKGQSWKSFQQITPIFTNDSKRKRGGGNHFVNKQPKTMTQRDLLRQPESPSTCKLSRLLEKLTID